MRGFPLVLLLGLVAVSGSAQTVRLAATVRAGQTYRHRIGRGLMVIVTTQGIAIRPALHAADTNYAACATPPAHGPNPLDIDGWHFDPAQSDAAPGLRREFEFALTAKANKMECALARAMYQDDDVPGYWPQRLGRGVLTLSQVQLNDSEEDVTSFRFTAIVTLPGVHTRQAWRSRVRR